MPGPKINGELIGAQIQQLSSDPSSPVESRFWYNSASKRFKFYDGTSIKVVVDVDYLLSVALANPMTAAGDIMYGGVGGAVTRLPKGNADEVFITGSTPAYAKISDANIASAAGIAQSKIQNLSSDLSTITGNVSSLNTQVTANTSAISNKADTSYVNTQLAAKADSSAVNTALAGKENTITVLPTTKGGTGANYADAAALIAGLLPSQTGNAGKFLSTSGSVLSWATALGLVPRPVAANVTAVSGDIVVVDSTAAARTIASPAGAAGTHFIVVDDKKTAGNAGRTISITPPSGTAFQGLANDAPIIINVAGGWVWVIWNGSSYTYITAGTGTGGGLTPVDVTALPATLVNGISYQNSQTASNSSLLPVTALAATIEVTDAKGTCNATNFMGITAGAGDTILYKGVPVTDRFVIRRPNATVRFNKAAGSTVWEVTYQTVAIGAPGFQPGYTAGLPISAGNIGERINSATLTNTTVPVNGADTTVGTLTLTAGSWIVYAVEAIAAAGTSTTYWDGSISTVSGSHRSTGFNRVFGSGANQGRFAVPPLAIDTTGQTVYLIASVVGSGTSPSTIAANMEFYAIRRA